MTDARLRGEWLTAMRLDDLSDTAWRVFTRGLMWSAENGTNGRVPTRYLKHLHPDGEQKKAFTELAGAELWKKTPDGYEFVDWDGALGQSTAEQVEAYKENQRQRAKRYREQQRKKLLATSTGKRTQGRKPPRGTRDVTSEVTGDVRANVGKAEAKAQEQAQARITKPSGSDDSVVEGWPVRAIPKSEPGWVETDPGVWAEAAVTS